MYNVDVNDIAISSAKANHKLDSVAIEGFAFQIVCVWSKNRLMWSKYAKVDLWTTNFHYKLLKIRSSLGICMFIFRENHYMYYVIEEIDLLSLNSLRSIFMPNYCYEWILGKKYWR